MQHRLLLFALMPLVGAIISQSKSCSSSAKQMAILLTSINNAQLYPTSPALALDEKPTPMAAQAQAQPYIPAAARSIAVPILSTQQPLYKDQDGIPPL